MSRAMDSNSHREFIRRLANDYLHYKIFGREQNTVSDILEVEGFELDQERRNRILGQIESHVNNGHDDENHSTTQDENNNLTRGSRSNINMNRTSDDVFLEEPFRKTSKVLRKVSVELERNNLEFFDTVCNTLNMENSDPERTFRSVSEQVLSHDSLNWGRVVSLFTFGGKVAEWFWRTQQPNKIPELEEWLTESIASKEDWIEQKGGWENFTETFSNPDAENETMTWLKSSLLAVCGVSLAVLFTLKIR